MKTDEKLLSLGKLNASNAKMSWTVVRAVVHSFDAGNQLSFIVEENSS